VLHQRHELDQEARQFNAIQFGDVANMLASFELDKIQTPKSHRGIEGEMLRSD
jgi:hypothetical protein